MGPCGLIQMNERMKSVQNNDIDFSGVCHSHTEPIHATGVYVNIYNNTQRIKRTRFVSCKCTKHVESGEKVRLA